MHWFRVCSVSRISFGICFMILDRNAEQDKMTCHDQEWKLLLSYFLSYLPFLYLNLISCPLCNTNTLWNILMILDRNIELDEMTCWVQKWQLWFSYFWSYLFCMNLISCPLCNSNSLHNILMILGSYLEQDETTCRLQGWQLWRGWGTVFFFFLKVVSSWRKNEHKNRRVKLAQSVFQRTAQADLSLLWVHMQSCRKWFALLISTHKLMVWVYSRIVSVGLF